MAYWVRHGLCISPSPPQLCSCFTVWVPTIVTDCQELSVLFSDILFFLVDGYSS